MKTDLLKTLESSLPPGWQRLLADEFTHSGMRDLCAFLNDEISQGKVVFPDFSRLLRAFQLTDYDQVKVVLLGQDPYHDFGQANGLAFAVDEGQKPPPSLRNIFRELSEDLCSCNPQSTTLEGWAQQGVLLLNTVLSVRAHQAFSHRERGWEKFTERAFLHLNSHPHPLVFLLWGSPAQGKAHLITDPRHLILRAPHPSPLSAYRGFFGCRHFSLANSFLAENGRAPINWLASQALTLSKI